MNKRFINWSQQRWRKDWRHRGWLGVTLILLFFASAGVAQSLQKVTYLYNSGFLIETANEIILIDYIPADKLLLDSILLHKLKKATESNKRAYILVTHEHSDHFYEPLLQWHHKINGLTTILGWDYPTTDKSILKVFNRDSITIGSFKLIAHPSTDAGSGFLINVDNITFYHAGDHAAWAEDFTAKFTDEIKFIKRVAKEINMVFIPIVRGKLGACKSTESITNGAMLTLQILNPDMVFPMHLQCDDLTPYKTFGKQVKQRFSSIITKIPLSNNYPFTF
ncbi:MAG: MBL fold metallo-hydrolase [Saprospiraceae bacterium]|nr:MBL fold metallo-hydrolase [Saprospiraceae bacterium]